MSTKQNPKNTPTDIFTMISFLGIMLLGSLLRLFVFGLGLIFIVAAFTSPEFSLPLKGLLIIIGFILVIITLFAKLLFKKIRTKIAVKPSKTRERWITLLFVGGTAVACLLFLPSAIYWTSTAVNASVVKSKETTTIATASEQTWQYPFMLNFRAYSITGRSSSTQQATVTYAVNNKNYSTTTMAHMPSSSTATTDIYYDPLNPQNAVTYTLWNTALLQAITFDLIALALALGSGFMIVAYLKDHNFLYAEKPKRK